MKTCFTIDDIKKSACGKLNNHLVAVGKILAKSKYGNKKTEMNSIWFDSAKEAGRYAALLIMEKANLIKDLQLQVEFELNEGGTHSLKYIADFVYTDCKTEEVIVEDVKGFKKVLYKKKAKLMQKIYGITIKET